MSSIKSSWHKGDALLKNKDVVENLMGGHLYKLLYNIAINRFEWSGLPEGMESRYIERQLYEYGQVAFVNDPVKGYLCLHSTEGGDLNVYGEPLGVQVIGVGYNERFNTEDVVRILDNDKKIPLRTDILYYACLLEDINKTINLNLYQQKFPYIIPTTSQTQKTLKAMYEAVDNGEPALFIDEKLADRGDSLIKVLGTNAPYLLDKLQQFKQEIIAEVMELLGINNSANNKKERLLVDEVNVNNNFILLNLELAYMYRQKAAEEINKKFGLNVKVEKVIDRLEVNFLGQIDDTVDGNNLIEDEGVE